MKKVMKLKLIDKIMLTTFVVILFLIGITNVGALDECGDSVPAGYECSIVTPYISFCSSYFANISYSNGTFHSLPTLGQINTLGIYNFTVNLTVADTYIIKLCDDSSRSLTVVDTSTFIPSLNNLWGYLLQIYYNTLPGGY